MSVAKDDLYQEVILDHYRRPRHRAADLEDCDVRVHHVNPLCGDELDVMLRVRDGALDAIAFDGEGCSISIASASAMAEAVAGRDAAEALAMVERFRGVMHGENEPDDELGDAEAFAGVAQYPVRVKCALLGWMALKDALVSVGGDDSTRPTRRSTG